MGRFNGLCVCYRISGRYVAHSASPCIEYICTSVVESRETHLPTHEPYLHCLRDRPCRGGTLQAAGKILIQMISAPARAQVVWSQLGTRLASLGGLGSCRVAIVVYKRDQFFSLVGKELELARVQRLA
jgi:hypothetical protein